MRCWNLGAEGQVLVGCLATGACMLKLSAFLPSWLLVPVMILSGIAAGALWAVIPAFFKAKFNTNETLFTLMMNYVATQLVAYFCVLWENPKGSAQIGIINQRSKIGWLPEVYNKQLLVILVIAAVTVFMALYLRYSKHGYEIAVVGESERTARYIGIHVEKVIMRTMLLSGAICGLAGMLLTASVNHTFSTTIVDGRGFTAVMVSWLAKFNPVIMVITSALLIFMNTGASDISTNYGLNQSFGDILTGILIFFIIGSEFFIHYRLSFSHAGKEAN
jgi:simple sugar transport system permease protein